MCATLQIAVVQEARRFTHFEGKWTLPGKTYIARDASCVFACRSIGPVPPHFTVRITHYLAQVGLVRREGSPPRAGLCASGLSHWISSVAAAATTTTKAAAARALERELELTTERVSEVSRAAAGQLQRDDKLTKCSASCKNERLYLVTSIGYIGLYQFQSVTPVTLTNHTLSID